MEGWAATVAELATQATSQASGHGEGERAKAAGECANAVANVAKEVVAALSGGEGGESSAEEAAQEAAALVGVGLRKALVECGKRGGDAVEAAQVLVDVAISLALGLQGGPPVASSELPYLLVEDLVLTQTVRRFGEAWAILETREALTSSELLPPTKVTRAKMAMLRIASYMVRRLSPLHDTVLCGRIMMFLAYAFPLSDRSGVNLLGAHNDANVTLVEDEASFAESTGEAEERAAQNHPDEASGPGPAEQESGEGINFALYSRFWELQRFFQNKADRAPNGCVSSAARWNQFVQVANVVLSAFESKPFSRADMDRAAMERRARKRKASALESEMQVDEAGHEPGVGLRKAAAFFPTKYLSSGRLLKLQLSDPTLRLNVLAQFLFLFRTLEGPESAMFAIAPSLRSSIPGAVEALRSRAVTLLKATPPDGESFARDLSGILAREEHWVRWKLAKCPNFERSSDPASGGGSDGEGEEEEDADKHTRARERARAAQLARVNERVRKNRGLWRCKLGSWKEDLAGGAGNPTPPFSEHVREMEIAIDPDNCIEEDYHPKHDTAYCWRGFRLLSSARLDISRTVTDGSFENATKRLVGKLVSPDANAAPTDGPVPDSGSSEVQAMEEEEDHLAGSPAPVGGVEEAAGKQGADAVEDSG